MTGHGGKREGAGRKPRPIPERALKLRATPDEIREIHALDTRKRARVLLEAAREERGTMYYTRLVGSRLALKGDLVDVVHSDSERTRGRIVQDGVSKSLVSHNRSDGEPGWQTDWYPNEQIQVVRLNPDNFDYMTNAGKARVIVHRAGGHVGECEDWLNDGDPDDMELEELVQEWREYDCTYVA